MPLIERGWQVLSVSGGGSVVHPKYPNLTFVSIAAAVQMEFPEDWKRRFYQSD
jgi:hypothetical protein